MVNATAETALIELSWPSGPDVSVEVGTMEAKVIDVAGDGTLTIANPSDGTVTVILRPSPD